MQSPLCIAIDWSGAAREPLSTLWLAVARAGRLLELWAPGTRRGALELVVARAQTESLVLGLDFCFSMPLWFARREGAANVHELWRLVAERGEHWLAQEPHPFWGRTRRRPPLEPEQCALRSIEVELKARAGVAPKSVFQIGGAGAVGTGSLRGMPWLPVLRQHGFCVWPFDAPALPMVLEIYPRLYAPGVNKSDRGQRRSALRRMGLAEQRWLRLASASEDAFDAAQSALCMSLAPSERWLSPAAVPALAREEGWIWRP